MWELWSSQKLCVCTHVCIHWPWTYIWYSAKIQILAGWGSELPDLVGDVPAHGKEFGARSSLKSLPTQDFLEVSQKDLEFPVKLVLWLAFISCCVQEGQHCWLGLGGFQGNLTWILKLLPQKTLQGDVGWQSWAADGFNSLGFTAWCLWLHPAMVSVTTQVLGLGFGTNLWIL